MVTDDHVWLAFTALKEEVKSWRIIESCFYDPDYVVAVRDVFPTPKFIPEQRNVETLAYERHTLSDKATAIRYIEWRSLKVALEEYEKIRSAE